MFEVSSGSSDTGSTGRLPRQWNGAADQTMQQSSSAEVLILTENIHKLKKWSNKKFSGKFADMGLKCQKLK